MTALGYKSLTKGKDDEDLAGEHESQSSLRSRLRKEWGIGRKGKREEDYDSPAGRVDLELLLLLDSDGESELLMYIE